MGVARGTSKLHTSSGVCLCVYFGGCKGGRSVGRSAGRLVGWLDGAVQHGVEVKGPPPLIARTCRPSTCAMSARMVLACDTTKNVTGRGLLLPRCAAMCGWIVPSQYWAMRVCTSRRDSVRGGGGSRAPYLLENQIGVNHNRDNPKIRT